MKRLVAALSAAALLLASTPALSDGNRQKHRDDGRGGHFSKEYGHRGGQRAAKHHGYKNYRPADQGHSRRGDSHRGAERYDYGPIIVGALVGGVVLGHLLSQPAYAAPSGYAPPPRPLLGNCRATTGTGYYHGRPAQFGGTLCVDQYGRGAMAPGSQYFIGYLR